MDLFFMLFPTGITRGTTHHEGKIRKTAHQESETAHEQGEMCTKTRVLVGVSVGYLVGGPLSGMPPMVENGPSQKAYSRGVLKGTT